MGGPHSRSWDHISRGLRLRWVALSALLLLVAISLYAKKNKATNAVDEQKRALHALDRLTFGPRPGDVQAVAAMGVDKWIDLQLHPERINDIAMQARLAEYRTLTMSSREMLFEFPPNPVIKAVMDGKAPMPRDPYRHAIYAAAMDRMNQQQLEKQNAAATAASAQNASAPSASLPILSQSFRQPILRSAGKTGVRLTQLWMTWCCFRRARVCSTLWRCRLRSSAT